MGFMVDQGLSLEMGPKLTDTLIVEAGDQVASQAHILTQNVDASLFFKGVL